MVTQVQLEYIVAVDSYRHFVTAAEKCFVTQPTLSMQIKKMEEYLDVVIFDRTKHPVVPTDIGIKIIEQAKKSLAEHKRIYELVDVFKGELSGDLTIGMIPSIAPYLLPRFIVDMARNHPSIKIKVVELLTEEIIEHLNKGLIDVGILATPLNDKEIIENVMFYEKMMVYINKSHKYSSLQSIPIADIAIPDLWLLSKGHCFRSHVMNLCNYQLENSDTHFVYESGSIESLKKIVDVDGGFTIVPELAIDKGYESKFSLVLPFKEITPLREISLVYTRNFVKKSLIDLLFDEVRKSVPEEMYSKERGVVVEWR